MTFFPSAVAPGRRGRGIITPGEGLREYPSISRSDYILSEINERRMSRERGKDKRVYY